MTMIAPSRLTVGALSLGAAIAATAAPAQDYEIWALDQGTHMLHVFDTDLEEVATVDLGAAGVRVAERAILDWEGVGDADGNPTSVTPEGIAALLDIWPIFEKFQMGYVAKGLELELEKNASAPSPTGSGAGAKAIARPAKGRARTARKS